jgi:hypothetical protein
MLVAAPLLRSYLLEDLVLDFNGWALMAYRLP